MDRVVLQKWLKSGYIDKHVLHETTEGTPQGGIVSPALPIGAGWTGATLEREVPGETAKVPWRLNPSINFIRYADDFVVTGKSKDLLEKEVQPLIEQFLRERGLKLSPRRQSPRTWKKALISLDKTCAAILTESDASSLPRETLKPSWMESEQQLKPGWVRRPPT